MDYQIYAYGHGEIVKSIFDALAMCLNGHDGTLFEALKRLGLILGVFWAAVYAIYGDMAKLFASWIIPSTVVMATLFAPQASVWIMDPVTNYRQKVDHVPYGLAAFAGQVSKIGYFITKEVEKVFVLPDDLSYHRSGALFASNILQKAKTFHITNQDVADNMRYFVEQCVVYDAMIGRKYTIEDLRHSDDLWRLVSENASPVRSFVWRNIRTARDGEFKNSSEIITCREGVTRFNRLWGQEINRTATIFGKKIFGNKGLINSRDELLRYLPISYEALGNLSKSASDIIRQQMMIFSIVDSVDQGATAAGHTPNFAARRAYLQQRSTYETLGAMAGETLPTMKAVLESVAYGAFLFVIPLALLPFGYRFLLAWAQILLWLQMWAPLYAILNYIMTIAARSKTMSVLSMSNDAGVTLATSVGVSNVNADMAAMAGYLAMSIPFLSIAIVKGVGSFVHMASHLGNVSQGAASMAAGEATSGNLSYGNISEGNVQIHQSHMFNQSRGSSYKAGSFQMMDGRTDVQTYSDGSQVGNVSTSNLPLTINKSESEASQESEAAAQTQQRGFSLNASSSENITSTGRQIVDLNKSLSESEHMADGSTQGVSVEQSKAIQKSASLIKSFATDNRMSVDKAASLFAEVSAGGGLLFKASAGGRTNLNASDTENLQKAKNFAKENNFQDAFREAAQAAKSISHTTTDESTRRVAEGISASYEKGMSERQEAAKNFSESESHTRQAMHIRANSASINANYNQQFMEWLSNQPADNAPGRMGTQSAIHIIANDPKMATAYANRFMEAEGLVPNGNHSPPPIRKNYEEDTRHQHYQPSQEPLETVRKEAGMDNTVISRGAALRADVQQQMGGAQQRIDRGESSVYQSGQGVQAEVNKQEGRYVTVRAAEALGKEAVGIGEDVVALYKGKKSQNKELNQDFHQSSQGYLGSGNDKDLGKQSDKYIKSTVYQGEQNNYSSYKKEEAGHITGGTAQSNKELLSAGGIYSGYQQSGSAISGGFGARAPHPENQSDQQSHQKQEGSYLAEAAAAPSYKETQSTKESHSGYRQTDREVSSGSGETSPYQGNRSDTTTFKKQESSHTTGVTAQFYKEHLSTTDSYRGYQQSGSTISGGLREGAPYQGNQSDQPSYQKQEESYLTERAAEPLYKKTLTTKENQSEYRQIDREVSSGSGETSPYQGKQSEALNFKKQEGISIKRHVNESLQQETIDTNDETDPGIQGESQQK